jgi:hypothetical protein
MLSIGVGSVEVGGEGPRSWKSLSFLPVNNNYIVSRKLRLVNGDLPVPMRWRAIFRSRHDDAPAACHLRDTPRHVTTLQCRRHRVRLSRASISGGVCICCLRYSRHCAGHRRSRGSDSADGTRQGGEQLKQALAGLPAGHHVSYLCAGWRCEGWNVQHDFQRADRAQRNFIRRLPHHHAAESTTDFEVDRRAAAGGNLDIDEADSAVAGTIRQDGCRFSRSQRTGSPAGRRSAFISRRSLEEPINRTRSVWMPSRVRCSDGMWAIS